VHIDKTHEDCERAEQQRHRLLTEHAEDTVDAARERRLRAENDHPRIDADEEVAPERKDHEEQQQIAVLRAAPRDERSERIAEREAKERGEQRVPDGLEEDLRVDRLGEEADVAVDVEVDLPLSSTSGARPPKSPGVRNDASTMISVGIAKKIRGTGAAAR
jgi:hypothetical protein